MEIKDKVDIPGYEGLYYATPDGEVFKYGTNHKMKLYYKPSRGVYYVSLTKNKKQTQVNMSKVMKMCFFNNTQDRLIHIGMKSDFSYWNLKPMSASDANRISAAGRGIPVVRVFDGEPQFYRSIAACSKENFISERAIGKYLRNTAKKTVDGAVYLYEKNYEQWAYRQKKEASKCT